MPIKVRTNYQTYITPSVVTSEGCNSIFFKNQGNVTIVVNNVELVRMGETSSISNTDPRIVLADQFRIGFDLDDNAAARGDEEPVYNCLVKTSFVQDAESIC